MRQIKYIIKNKALRWIAYIDLLGTKKLIYGNKAKDIFIVYRKAIEEFKNQSGNMEDINSIWFSDTFILYSDDNSINGYAEVEHLARWFHYHLIKEGIPVRGAISYGDFYCDKENNLFFGKPLVEAYEYSEIQNWLGLIICPSAERKLKPLNIISGPNSAYVYTRIPTKKDLTDIGNESIILPACILSCWLPSDFQERFSHKLKIMMETQDGVQRIKYKNTIDFIEKNSRVINL
jgi:hypothetical protein